MNGLMMNVIDWEVYLGLRVEDESSIMNAIDLESYFRLKVADDGCYGLRRILRIKGRI